MRGMFTRRFIAAVLASMVLFGCYPPQVQYPYTKLVHTRRSTLQENLLKLLPEEQQQLVSAQQEAKWLADTAYKAAAGISRVNASHFPGWAGNALVNTNMQDRGLCWHYQHDLYRELRRRKLEFFRLGCCVRDKAKRTEHNCVYIAAAQGVWPNAWVLDAWMWNGRLKVDLGTKLNPRRWTDLPEICTDLANFYKEGHAWPVEHWMILRNDEGKYSYCNSRKVLKSPQFIRMNENIAKGYRDHPGSPTNY